METKFEEVFSQVLEHLKALAKTETVIGQQFQLGEYTCVPVIRVNMGFGSGFGEGAASDQDKGSGKGSGGGTGAGFQAAPIAFLVSRGGQIDLLNIGKEAGKGLQALFDSAPGLIDKFMSMQKKGKEDKKPEGEEAGQE